MHLKLGFHQKQNPAQLGSLFFFFFFNSYRSLNAHQCARRLPRGKQSALERLEHHQLMTNLHRAFGVSRREQGLRRRGSRLLAAAGQVVMSIKFGAKPVEFEKGKVGIVVGSKDSCRRGSTRSSPPCAPVSWTTSSARRRRPAWSGSLGKPLDRQVGRWLDKGRRPAYLRTDRGRALRVENDRRIDRRGRGSRTV